MKRHKQLATGIAAALGMLCLILDAQTALTGASDGIDLCVRTVIPALFPFFVLSSLLTGSLLGGKNPVLRPVAKLCGIPTGAESLLITGLLGGYPVGAQCVSQACCSGQLSRKDARRMLGFCNNPGPAFIFGMSGFLFENKTVSLILWVIQILSALITAMLLPKESDSQAIITAARPLTVGQALHKSLVITGTVCGWVILFRIILSFAERWFLWLIPSGLQIALTGILELTNGYIGLTDIQDDSLRFIIASGLLSFGGVCVWLQTASVIGQAGLDPGSCFTGKLIQTVLSVTLAAVAAQFLFDPRMIPFPLPILFILLVAFILVIKKRKNSSSIPEASVV